MITVRKLKKESTLGLLRRFSQRIKSSKILEKAKERRYRERVLSKKRRKFLALKFLNYQKKRKN